MFLIHIYIYITATLYIKSVKQTVIKSLKGKVGCVQFAHKEATRFTQGNFDGEVIRDKIYIQSVVVILF